jgi:hypothetical protein
MITRYHGQITQGNLQKQDKQHDIFEQEATLIKQHQGLVQQGYQTRIETRLEFLSRP